MKILFKILSTVYTSGKRPADNNSVLCTRNDFFGSGSVSGSGSSFSDGFGSGSGSCLRFFMSFFSNILDINFIFVFPSRKCVNLHIMTRYKLFKDVLQKGISINILKLSILKKLSNFISFSEKLRYTSNSFRIRSWPDPECFFLRIRILIRIYASVALADR
jgi:hypothetical protein